MDKGFLQRFSNAKAKVESYSDTVKKKLQSAFPVSVHIKPVEEYTSYCDTCKYRSFGGSWSWNFDQLAEPCHHEKILHLSVNPGRHTPDKSTGFYFDFVRYLSKNGGLGTKTAAKVMWTGHIPQPTNQPSFSVQEYEDDCTNSIPHHIVCMMLGHVTDASKGYKNKPLDVVKREYEFTLLHELSHQLGAPDHYRCWNDRCYCNSPATCGKSHDGCSNKGCWTCYEDLPRAAG